MLLHHRVRPRKTAGSQKIIGAEHHEVLRAGPVDPLVVGRVEAEIASAGDYRHPPVLRGKLLRHLDAVVGGGVVDNEDADVSDPLGQHARDAIAQESPILVTGNHDVDAGEGLLRSVFGH